MLAVAYSSVLQIQLQPQLQAEPHDQLRDVLDAHHGSHLLLQMPLSPQHIGIRCRAGPRPYSCLRSPCPTSELGTAPQPLAPSAEVLRGRGGGGGSSKTAVCADHTATRVVCEGSHVLASSPSKSSSAVCSGKLGTPPQQRRVPSRALLNTSGITRTSSVSTRRTDWCLV